MALLPSKFMYVFSVLVGQLMMSYGENMNGDYIVASGDKIGVHFNTDYKSKGHEYFDVYSPELATHYGEVFWTDQGNNPIPQDIIDRFKGKTIAITGYEVDVVRGGGAGSSSALVVGTCA